MHNKRESDKPQAWLITIMQALGYYKTNPPEALCFGVSHMGMQAIFAGEIDKFDARLKLMRDKGDSFPAYFNSAMKAQKERLELGPVTRKCSTFNLRRV